MLVRSARLFASLLALGVALALPARGEVKVEKVAYFNQPNCYRLSNGTVEVIVTTDIGPRIIRYGFIGGDNMLAELPATTVTKTALGDWHPWGGSRLWHAPEEMPRSYVPDDSPIQYKLEGTNAIRLIEPVEGPTGIQKEILVTLDPTGSGVTLDHTLTNKGLWAVDMAPWVLTIVNPGGTTIIPQEPYASHDVNVLPARPLVFWYYTDLSDPRWAIGKKYIRLKTNPDIKESQKIGVLNKQGWAAYDRNNTLFVKRFPYKDGATYPDFNCNNETYTAGDFMEIESLGPMAHVQPGDAVSHRERWYLFKNVNIGPTEATLDAAISPLIAQTK